MVYRVFYPSPRTQDEIHAIVERRRQSEYLLRRRAARKADFLRYAEVEMSLERLRFLRYKKLLLGRGTDGRIIREHKKIGNAYNNKDDDSGRDKKKKKIKMSKKNMGSIGDAHVVKHIHFIFRRAKMKWKDDVSLHLAHAAFAKQARSYAELDKIYAHALQIHPRNVSLWIEAASHEFFGYVAAEDDGGGKEGSGGKRGSIKNARILFQRGLRVNEQSQELWIQYFTLEWHYVQMQRGRRIVLNPDEARMNNVDAEDIFPSLIYKNAIKAIPENISFRLKFLKGCKPFPNTGNFESMVLQSLESDFGGNVDAWVARAAFAYKDGDKADMVGSMLKVLVEGLNRIKTEEMFEKCASFLMELLSREFVASTFQENSTVHEIVCVLEMIFSLSQREKIFSVQLSLLYANFLCNIGKPEKAVEFLRTGVIKPFSTSSFFWIALVNHVERGQLVGLKGTESLVRKRTFNDSPLSILRRAESFVPIYDGGYMQVMKYLFKELTKPDIDGATLKSAKQVKNIEDIFRKILLLPATSDLTATSTGNKTVSITVHNPSSTSVADVCLHYLAYNLAMAGLEGGRQVCDIVLFHSNLSCGSYGGADCEDMKQFFNAAIMLEKNSIILDSGWNIEGESLNQSRGGKRLKKLFSGIIAYCAAFGDENVTKYYTHWRDEEV